MLPTPVCKRNPFAPLTRTNSENFLRGRARGRREARSDANAPREIDILVARMINAISFIWLARGPLLVPLLLLMLVQLRMQLLLALNAPMLL